LKTDIITAKLQMPHLANWMVDRDRLLQKMDSFREKPVTCVVAPAGYGKTVFIRQFAGSTGLPCVWYQLDATDNDPAPFFTYLANGLSRAVPDFRLDLPDYRQDGLSGDKICGLFLSAALQELEKKVQDGLIIVFDDFHAIHEGQILHFVENFLSYLPEKVHVVLCCRYLPDIQLLRLKAEGRMIEIERQDLEFNQKEIQELFCAQSNNKIGADILEEIDKSMNGWALGLFVLKLAIENSRDGVLSAAVYKSKSEIFRYFLSDLFNSLPPDIREFLKATSTLELLTPEACNYILDKKDSSEKLSYLADRNLFITSSGWEESISYRYHPIFRTFLLTLLHDKKTDSLVRAGQYYEKSGFYEYAVECFISADRADLVAEVAGHAALPVLWEGKIKTVDRWMSYLEEKHGFDSPNLIIAKGALLSYSGNFNAAEPWIDRVISLYGQTDNPEGLFRAKVHKARILRYRSSFRESLRLLESLAPDMDRVPFGDRMEAVMETIYSLWLSGNMSKAIETAEKALADAKSCGGKDAEKAVDRLSGYMTVLYYNQGEYTNAMLYYNKALEANGHNYDALEVNSVNLFAAWIYRERGYPAKAIELLKECIRRKKRLGFTEDMHLIYYNAALACNDLHNLKDARLYMDLALESFKEAGGNLEEYEDMLNAINYVLLSEHSDAKKGELLLDSCICKLREKKDSLLLYSSFHFGVAYIRLGLFDKAQGCIELPLQMSRQIGLKQFTALLSGLMVNILLSRNDEKGALSYAEDCLKYSAAEKYIQTFITYPEMQPCIYLAIENNIQPEFIHDLIRFHGEAAELFIDRLFNSSRAKARLAGIELLKEMDLHKNAWKYQILFFDPDAEVRLKAYEAARQSGSSTEQGLYAGMTVSCFGKFKAYTQDDRENPVKWRTAKAKELFAYLIHWNGRSVSTERIMADIWPEADPEKARNLLHTNLTYVRNVLAGCGLEKSLKKIQSGYTLEPSGITCDMWLAEREDGDIFFQKLYGGQYMEDIYSDWPMNKRAEFECR
jgi:tetratricopeptide (TPR) repeat protein